MSAPDNTPAFPSQPVTLQGEPCSPNFGMSQRDWFAGQALVGICVKGWPSTDSINHAARTAYQLADAMLAESKKGGTQ